MTSVVDEALRVGDGIEHEFLPKVSFAELVILGKVCLPNSPEYANALARVYNRQAVVDFHPLAIVEVSGSRDVAVTIAFCKAKKLTFSVLGGGINPSGLSMSGSVVLDMARMRFVRVEEGTGRALVGAGLTFRELDWELEGLGRCIPGPLYGAISCGGAMLGGGWGFLSKVCLFGFFCFFVAPFLYLCVC